jgi:hypothetical protein
MVRPDGEVDGRKRDRGGIKHVGYVRGYNDVTADALNHARHYSGIESESPRFTGSAAPMDMIANRSKGCDQKEVVSE